VTGFEVPTLMQTNNSGMISKKEVKAEDIVNLMKII
jgi:hypothetical protein